MKITVEQLRSLIEQIVEAGEPGEFQLRSRRPSAGKNEKPSYDPLLMRRMRAWVFVNDGAPMLDEGEMDAWAQMNGFKKHGSNAYYDPKAWRPISGQAASSTLNRAFLLGAHGTWFEAISDDAKELATILNDPSFNPNKKRGRPALFADGYDPDVADSFPDYLQEPVPEDIGNGLGIAVDL